MVEVLTIINNYMGSITKYIQSLKILYKTQEATSRRSSKNNTFHAIDFGE